MAVFCVVPLLFLDFSVGVGAFFHRTESDLFLFLSFIFTCVLHIFLSHIRSG